MAKKLDPQEWAKRIRSLRKKLGETQEGIAEAFGVSVRTIARWEAGYGMPRAEHLELAKELTTACGKGG